MVATLGRIGFLVQGRLQRSWTALLGLAALLGAGTVAPLLVGASVGAWGSWLLAAVVLATPFCSATPADLRHQLTLPGTRLEHFLGAWFAGALPAAVLAGLAGWAAGSSFLDSVGFGLFVATVFVGASILIPSGDAVVVGFVTAAVLLVLGLAGVLWIGARYAVAIGAEAPAWYDLALWWGLALLVPGATMVAAWFRLRPQVG